MSKNRGMDPHLADVLARAAANAPTAPDDHELFEPLEATLRKNADYRRQTGALTDLHISIPLNCVDGCVSLEKVRGANFFEFDSSRRKTAILLFGKSSGSGLDVKKGSETAATENESLNVQLPAGGEAPATSNFGKNASEDPSGALTSIQTDCKEKPKSCDGAPACDSAEKNNGEQVAVDESPREQALVDEVVDQTNSEQAATTVVDSEQAATTVVDSEQAANTVVDSEQAATTVVDSEQAATTVVDSEQAATTVVDSEQAATTVVDSEQAATTVVDSEQAATTVADNQCEVAAEESKAGDAARNSVGHIQDRTTDSPSACDVWASYMQLRLGTIYNVRPEQMSTVLQVFKEAFEGADFQQPLAVAFSGLYHPTRNGRSADTRAIETLGVPLTPDDGARWDRLKLSTRRFASNLVLYSRRFELAARNPHVPVPIPGGVRLPVPGRPTVPAALPHEQPRLRVELSRFVGPHPVDLHVVVREHRPLNDKALLRMVRDHPRQPLYRSFNNSAVMVVSEIRLEHLHEKATDPRWPKLPIQSRKIFTVERPARHVFCTSFVPPRVRQPDESESKPQRPEYKKVAKGVCRFDRTPSGCHRGDSCAFLHGR